jgi:hypothetical protein
LPVRAESCDFDRSDFSECASATAASATPASAAPTGAKYDCATKLPDDLDPVAAGMINVEGTCPQRMPQ